VLAIYIHYPYCKSKCPYCDFNSHVRSEIDFANLKLAYFQEIEFFAQNSLHQKVSSIFFGGGTPSLMPINLVENILSKISQYFQLENNCEITLEANPTSSEAQKFISLKNIGINRLSLGIQALNDDDLKFLGREHSATEAIKTIEIAKNIFKNFSFDLIYARPKQSISDWQKELKQALDFAVPHLSLYQLTIEKGTKFFSEYQQNKFNLPDENLSTELYEMTSKIMQENNYLHYEISNFAKPNFQSRHNLQYWKSGDYIGIGAGAHSRVRFKNNHRMAIQMISEPNNWITKNLSYRQNHKNFSNKIDLNQVINYKINAIQDINLLDKMSQIEEIVLMGLRLESGIDLSIFLEFFNKDFFEIFDKNKINFLIKNNFLKIENNHLKIPLNHRIITNKIIEKTCESIALNN
jgi:oxygen-independent coproporphyrinogen-3 oxidase